tara:strand:+ start:228 stop:503 length:276 start_codon:yes stop_codon:yes gene_type:complete
MGVASLYDRVHTFDCELGADFITLDCQVSYRINPGDGDAEPQTCELVKVTTRIAGAEGPVINITPIINFDYIMDLCEEDASNADVCVEDYL